jgi:hypothetical protein
MNTGRKAPATGRKGGRRPDMELVVVSAQEGDLVFVAPGKFNISVTGQRFLRRKVASSVEHSHVAVVLMPALVAHATTEDGVHIQSLYEFIRSRPDATVTIRRNPALLATEGFREAMQQAMLFHLGKTYNYLITRERNSPALFCSEFASAVYEKVGHPFGKPHAKTLPVDIALATEGWQDVTGEVIHWYPADSTDADVQFLILSAKADADALNFKPLYDGRIAAERDAAKAAELLNSINAFSLKIGAAEVPLPKLDPSAHWSTAGPKVVSPERRKSASRKK